MSAEMKRFFVIFYLSFGIFACGGSTGTPESLFDLDFSNQSTSVTPNEVTGFWEVSSADSVDAHIACDYRLKIEEDEMTISARVRGNGMSKVQTESVSIDIENSTIVSRSNVSIYVETDVDSRGLFYFCPPTSAPIEFRSGVGIQFVLEETKLHTLTFGSLRKIADLSDE